MHRCHKAAALRRTVPDSGGSDHGRQPGAGGARRDRTADLVIANDALSQLSYGPIATASTLTTTRQSVPFTIRTKVKSRTAKTPFRRHLPGTSLVCKGMNRYLARSRIRDQPRE